MFTVNFTDMLSGIDIDDIDNHLDEVNSLWDQVIDSMTSDDPANIEAAGFGPANIMDEHGTVVAKHYRTTASASYIDGNNDVIFILPGFDRVRLVKNF